MRFGDVVSEILPALLRGVFLQKFAQNDTRAALPASCSTLRLSSQIAHMRASALCEYLWSMYKSFCLSSTCSRALYFYAKLFLHADTAEAGIKRALEDPAPEAAEPEEVASPSPAKKAKMGEVEPSDPAPAPAVEETAMATAEVPAPAAAAEEPVAAAPEETTVEAASAVEVAAPAEAAVEPEAAAPDAAPVVAEEVVAAAAGAADMPTA